jgi:formylmethanofuran dehydrogenase subunit B
MVCAGERTATDAVKQKQPTEAETQRAWLIVANQVLRGQWRNATETEREAIAIGLRSYTTSQTCREALAQIQPKKKDAKPT